MSNYKPVKIMFDLDDDYQLKLYNHLKNRTNGSSYIRTLLHQDLNGDEVRNSLVHQTTSPPINNYEQPSTVDDTTDMKTSTVKSVVHSGIKINVNNQPIEEDVFVEDLI